VTYDCDNLQHAISSTVPDGIRPPFNNRLLHSASKQSTPIVDPGDVASVMTS